MSQTHTQRRTAVMNVLEAEKVKPGKGRSLAEVADRVLSELDHIKESIR